MNEGVQWDNAVEATSDDAAISKLSAINLGYYQDPFLKHLVARTRSKPIRRSPIINRGYFARVAARDKVISQFLMSVIRTTNQTTGSTDSKKPKVQIVALGAGCDTIYFRLKQQQVACMKQKEADGDQEQEESTQHVEIETVHRLEDVEMEKIDMKFVEVDLPAVIERKAKIICQTEQINSLIESNEAESEEPSLMQALKQKLTLLPEDKAERPISRSREGVFIDTDDYTLVAADIRKVTELLIMLKSLKQFDASIPTLFLSECVMVYLEPGESLRILSALSKAFPSSAVFVYEQIRPDDAFGKVMTENLKRRGCPLKGLPAHTSPEMQIERFTTKAGFRCCECLDMNEIYYHVLDKQRLKTIEKLEIFDEFEEWHLMQAHYCIVLARQFPDDSPLAKLTLSPTPNQSADKKE